MPVAIVVPGVALVVVLVVVVVVVVVVIAHSLLSSVPTTQPHMPGPDIPPATDLALRLATDATCLRHISGAAVTRRQFREPPRPVCVRSAQPRLHADRTGVCAGCSAYWCCDGSAEVVSTHGRHGAVSVGAEHRTLREMVADAIRAKIVNGEIRPGERLYEDRLAEELGVSRNPVRESIRALEATGLIEVVPRRGAYVVDIETAELAQLLEVRAVLEAHAAGLAARWRSDDDLAELDRCLAQGVKASTRNDMITAAECHRDFHLAIERASRNPFIGETAGPLRNRTELVFSMLADSRGLLSWEEHRHMRDAIADGDAGLASSRALQHMAGVINDLTSTANPA